MQQARYRVELKYNCAKSDDVDLSRYVHLMRTAHNRTTALLYFDIIKSIFSARNATEHTLLLMQIQRAIYRGEEIEVYLNELEWARG